MSHPDPYDAIKVHKSKVLNASNQKIFINRQSGTILRDLFKKLKQGELDVKKKHIFQIYKKCLGIPVNCVCLHCMVCLKVARMTSQIVRFWPTHSYKNWCDLFVGIHVFPEVIMSLKSDLQGQVCPMQNPASIH
ncbi:hypothetical protein OS493_000651 [Desmophyllum pertusum]|uniref:Uncharacterized protein n=1 Tax=Desmophyllum pertusum TaxID=174260 RepID=A0A9X0A7K5_9CNID|nr:hypothetical protein OS493_000651 [Desmophyllum pertusum]